MSGSDQDFFIQLRSVFVSEAREHLHSIASGMAALRKGEDPATLKTLYRAAHSVKGSARSAGLNAIGSVCQALEDSYAALQKGNLAGTPENLGVLQQAVDCVSGLLAAAPDEMEPDVDALIARIAALPRGPAALTGGTGDGLPTPALPAKPLRALIIEDSEFDALLLQRELRKGGYNARTDRVEDADALSAALAREPWDIVFSDHHMPHFNSTAALKLVRAASPDTPFIIVSGSIGEEFAVTAMKAGAQDYLMKGNLTRLAAAVDREIQDARDRQARRAAESALLAQKEELRIAREIQEHLFPVNPTNLAGFDIAGASHPAEATGGDYYDFIGTPRGETLVVIGDVTGHGLGPALLMADVRATLRALAADHARLADVLDLTNRLLRADLSDDRFVTLLLAALTPATRRLQFINAGHPAGFVIDRDGLVKAELPPCVAALGLLPDIVFPEAGELTLAPSDLVVLLTDGVLEATSPAGEEFGTARALEVVRRVRHEPAAAIINHLVDAVRDYAGDAAPLDDVSAIIIKVD